MIDLSVSIRSFLLADAQLNALIPNYKNSKAIFTRRPLPDDATGLVVIISPLVSSGFDSDYLNRWQRMLTFDVSVYGPNDTPANYLKVQDAGFRIVNIMHRLNKQNFVMPQGWQLVNAKAYGPISAPVDDDKTVGRLVSINFLVAENADHVAA